jgi:hypothetical protein
MGVGLEVIKKRPKHTLSKVFKPNPREIILEEENKLLSDAITATILDKSFIVKEMRVVIKNLNSKKAPSYDQV